MGLAAALMGVIASTSALAELVAGNGVSLDNGDRLVVPFHMKIEHRNKSAIEILLRQADTREGRKILAALASLAGFNPGVAAIVTANIPVLSLPSTPTDNRGVIAAPKGMTICKAGPKGNLEASHAAWSASIFRNDKQN